jgi:hypothetical protein
MKSAQIYTGFVSAQLVLNETADLAQFATEMGCFLPGGWQLEKGTKNQKQTIIEVTTLKPGLLPSLKITKNNKFALQIDSSTINSRLPFITYTILERDRQLAGMATVHGSAAVAPKGVGILILGDKGSGKTNTLLALLKQQCLPAGDDIIVLKLDNKCIVKLRPGKRVASVRGSNIKGGKSFYEIKRHISLSNLNFLESDTPLALVVRVNVHSDCSCPNMQCISNASTVERLRLHENIGRYISGLPTPLVINKTFSFCPILPLDTNETALFRSRLVSSLIKLPFYYLEVRTADEAATAILNLVRLVKGKKNK